MNVDTATTEALSNLFDQFKPDETHRPAVSSGYKFDVYSYLRRYGVEVVKTKQHGGSTLYCLKTCLFNGDHNGNEASIGQTADGKLFYQCFHDSCKGKTWHDARQVISGSDRIGDAPQPGIQPPNNPAPADEHSQFIYIPTWDNCPPEAEVLVKLNDTPVLHRQNLCMLTAGAGLGKTAALHAALPTLISPDNKTIGLSAFGCGATVLDTEHDSRLFNLLWQRFMYRCGLSRGTATPDNIKWKNIRAVESLDERLSILWGEFKSCPGLLVVDGIGDFVADPNNSDECTALVYRLSSEAQKHDIGVLLSLHNNPVVGNEKARGVLGSELWRKAQSTLMIKRNADGIAQITTEYSLGKNRQNSDRLSAFFCWDDDLKMHVACDPPEEGSNTGKSAKQQQEIIMALRGEYSHKDLVELVMGITKVKKRQAANKINDLVEKGLIEKTAENLYRERKSTHWSDDL